MGKERKRQVFLTCYKYVWKFYFPTDSIDKTTRKQGSETRK